MEEEIKTILDQYYSNQLPSITNLQILDSSLDSGILCIRWRHDNTTITIKSIKEEDNYIITQLQ